MTKGLTIAVVWALATFVGAILFYKTGPTLEEWLAPVLVDQAVDQVVREDNRVCWRWTWTKTQDATPHGFAWSFTIDGTAVDYPAVVFRETDGQVIGPARAHPPGRGERHLCAAIPDTLRSVKGLMIEGAAEYQPRHGLWTLWQGIPIVPVPSIQS